MVNKTLAMNSYASSLSQDSTMILNISKKATLLRVGETGIKRLCTYNSLKLPSTGAISSDLSAVAYKNANGQVAINNATTGQLILKHNAVMNEGCGVFFTHDNKSILSSTWACDVFIIDILSGEIDVQRIGNGEYRGATILLGGTPEEFFVYCKQMTKEVSSRLYRLTLLENKVVLKPDCDMPRCSILTPMSNRKTLLFSSDSNSVSKIYRYDIEGGSCHEYMDIQLIYSSYKKAKSELQKVTFISATCNGEYIIVVCNWKNIMIVETSQKKCIKCIEHNYTSNIALLNGDRTLWIGTWERTYLYDFYNLCSG